MRQSWSLTHADFLASGDFIVFPFKSTIHGPHGENLVSFALFCTNVSHDCCKLLHNSCKGLLIHSRIFPSTGRPKLFWIWPQGIPSPFSSNSFSRWWPLMGSTDAHPERAGGTQVSEERSDGRGVAFPSHCRQSLDSSWPLTHPAGILSGSCGSPPQCDTVDELLSASSL